MNLTFLIYLSLILWIIMAILIIIIILIVAYIVVKDTLQNIESKKAFEMFEDWKKMHKENNDRWEKGK